MISNDMLYIDKQKRSSSLLTRIKSVSELKMDLQNVREIQEKLLSRQLIQTYLRNVESYLSESQPKVSNGLGNEHIPDERLMRFIETKGPSSIPENGVREFRETAIRPLLSKRTVDICDLPFSFGQGVRDIVQYYMFLQEFLICRSSWGCVEEFAKKKKNPIKVARFPSD